MMLKSRCSVALCLGALDHACFGRSAFVGRPTGRVLAAGSCHSSSTSLQPSTTDYKDELPPDFPRRHDVLVALEAVRKACRVTQILQPEHARRSNNSENIINTVTKQDLSPVTVADFAAQAVVLNHLHTAFPADSFIAEESSLPLVQDENLAQQVVAAAALADASAALIEGICQSIDLGKQYETWNDATNPRPPRVWCLDPIDGTKGFLRGKKDGGQYCVALALLEQGVPTIGVLGCPNLPASPTDFSYAWKDDETVETYQRGCIFVASRGGGCYQLPLVPGTRAAVRLHVTRQNDDRSPSQGRFCVGVEKFGDALGQCAGMARVLHGNDGVDADGNILNARRIDSQAKYGVLARAGAE